MRGPSGSGKTTYARGLEAEDLATLYVDHFEPPTADEGPLTLVG